MTYYSREGRMGFPPRQQFGPPPMPMPRQRFGPPRMPRQQFGSPMQYYPQWGDSFYPGNPYNYGPWQQQVNPYQQMQNPGNGRPNNMNTLMGHMGTITNGINMMRQFGSILSLFR